MGVAVMSNIRQSVARRIAETTEKALSGGGYFASSGVTRSWASSIINSVLFNIGSSGVSARLVPSGNAPKPRPTGEGWGFPWAINLDVNLLAGKLQTVIPLRRFANSSNVTKFSCFPIRFSRSSSGISLPFSPKSVAVSVFAKSSLKF